MTAITDSYPDLYCNVCHRLLQWKESQANCEQCGQRVPFLSQRLPYFGDSSESQSVENILHWSDSFLALLESTLPSITDVFTGEEQLRKELQAQGLLDEDGRPTRLASNLAYHMAEFQLQISQQKRLYYLLDVTGLDRTSRILDIGCGAGQTLRIMESWQPAERVGLDVDPIAVAFGCRLAEFYGQDISFVRTSAEFLPFSEHRFTHIISRVSLNYMKQQQTLREMVRVLKPGGYIFCHVEGIGYDLMLMKNNRSPRYLLGRLRNFVAGAWLAFTGWQVPPSQYPKASRAFGSLYRLRKILAQTGCPIIEVFPTARLLGIPLGYEFLARKAP